ncbi:MAG: YbaK/EbsC family protein [Dehalococcoidia bacterium]
MRSPNSRDRPRGGVSPLGSRKAYPLFLDESALLHESISVSAGMRGLQLLIAPADLVHAANATLAPLTERPPDLHQCE